MNTYSICYQDKKYSCRSNETILQAFNRQGININLSCQKGKCKVCMMKYQHGVIPSIAQKNLQQAHINQSYFLPCCCYPVEDMHIKNIPIESSLKSDNCELNSQSLSPKKISFNIQKTNEIWMILGQGKKLKIILEDFYSRTYEDDKLSA